jgi:type I restriction-modification system DNA methylase subunit
MARRRAPNGNGSARRLSTPQSVNAAVKSICDIMRRSNCAGALQYVPELTWILFLRILDEREQREAEEAEAVGAKFTPSLESPYRWRDWPTPRDRSASCWARPRWAPCFPSSTRSSSPPSRASRTSPGRRRGRRSSARSCRGSSGRASDNAIYPIALANLVLHNIDEPHIWHGNVLTGQEVYGGLFADAPALFDVILMNPPFGGKEGKEAQTRFAYKTGATQVLFLQHVIDSLKPGGRCGIVLDEGVLFRTNETAFVQTKRKLLDECDLFCLVSLPPDTFVNAGAGVKTNLLFFTRGRPTERIWYYDLSRVKVGKKTPLTLAHFEECLRLLPDRADSERSWTVTRDVIEAKSYDLKAVNPNARSQEDRRTPEELLDLIEVKGREVAEAVAALRALRSQAEISP